MTGYANARTVIAICVNNSLVKQGEGISPGIIPPIIICCLGACQEHCCQLQDRHADWHMRGLANGQNPLEHVAKKGLPSASIHSAPPAETMQLAHLREVA